MKDSEYQIIHDEILSIADYALSSRTMVRTDQDYKKLKSPGNFYEKLLSHITDYNHSFFIDDFLTYSRIRLKIALTTRDFSCLEFVIWLCYRIWNNKNISERTKSEIKLLGFLNHKFLCLPREYKIFSPIQKFSGHKNIFSYVDYYSKYNFKDMQGHIVDYSFMIDHFKNIALIENNLTLSKCYNIKDLHSFDTLPDEVKKFFLKSWDLGYLK